MVLVGRVARPHGLRGQVVVNPETDFATDRFRPGAVLWTKGRGDAEQLTVSSARFQGGRPVVGFEGLTRIEDVEPLAGRELRVPEQALRPLEAGRYYEHQLAGCAVDTVAGDRIGTVARVESGAGASRLVVTGSRGEILIPFVSDICVAVDVGARTIRINPPEGLIELNEVRHRHDLSADGAGVPRGGGRQPGH
jgi:16S rRNA processing protein RimM